MYTGLNNRFTGYTPLGLDALSTSVRGMQLQMAIVDIYSKNVANADVPGYQKKEPVIMSFADVLGSHGLSEITNTDVGRLMNTQQPLDIALEREGYFQKLKPDGSIELTRDGRLKLDKAGRLISTDGYPLLSHAGKPIVFPYIPGNLNDIRINNHGEIRVLHPKTKRLEYIDTVGAVSSAGKTLGKDINLRQGYIEQSNVLAYEAYAILAPHRRNFQANKQMFVNENQLLSRVIQELGRAQ